MSKEKLITIDGLSTFKDRMQEYIDAHDYGIATESAVGVVKPDGVTIKVREDGSIYTCNPVVLTQAEYDALPDTKYTDGILYIISDAGETDVLAMNVAYNNATSKLESKTVQEALDELASSGIVVQIATTERAGIVKPDGTTITVDADGTIHGVVPTKTSELTNDSGFITEEADPTVPAHVKGITEKNIADWNAKSDFSGDYNDLDNKPIIPTVPTDVSAFNNDAGYISEETDPTVPAWAKKANKPTYTAAEVGALPSDTVIPTKVSELDNDSNFISTETDPTVPAHVKAITAQNITDWNAKSTFSGSYNDLTDKPTIPTVPTDVSAFNNDAGYITDDALVNYSLISATGCDLGLSIDTKTYEMTVELKNADGTVLSTKSIDFPIESMVVNASYADGKLTLTLQSGQTLDVDISSIVGGLVNESRKIAGVDLKDDITAAELKTALGLSTVATSGSYNDLSNKPTIPTKVSQLTNDSKFLTTETDPTVPSHVKGITTTNITNWNEKISSEPTLDFSNVDDPEFQRTVNTVLTEVEELNEDLGEKTRNLFCIKEETKNGITIIDNHDGTYTANGTATGIVAPSILDEKTTLVEMPAGTYVTNIEQISGTAEQGSTILCFRHASDSSLTDITSFENNVPVTFNTTWYLQFRLAVRPNIFTNFRFRGMLVNGTKTDGFVPHISAKDYIAREQINKIYTTNFIKSKKITVIGDSITASKAYTKKLWTEYIEEINECNIQNLGVSGTGFVRGSAYVNRLPSIDSDTDLIGVACSFNDLMSDVTKPLGVYTDTDKTTIMGCANDFFTRLLNMYPTKPIIAYIQSPWDDRKYGTSVSDDYISEMKKLCAIKQIPFYADLYDKGCLLKPWIDANKNVYYLSDNPDYPTYYNTTNGVHPNSIGHKVIAKYISEKFNMNIL